VAKGIIFIDGIPALSGDTASGAPSDVTDNVPDKTAAIVDYANFGPNNELYLAPGQGISFALNGQDGIANVKKVHLALKSVGGTSQVVICGVKEDNTLDFVAGSRDSYVEVKTATDLYYDITKLKNCKAIVIYNPNNPANGASHSILSITNLKLTHAANPANKGTVQPAVSRAVAKLALNALKPVVVNPFADVREESYYYNSILWAAAKGITCGTDATHFSPDETCSRGQVVTFLWRSAGCPEPEKSTHPFVDVPSDSYYYKAVLWAVENGITAGVDESHFDPNEVCSRGQVVTFRGAQPVSRSPV
jgi:hypothetical protein